MGIKLNSTQHAAASRAACVASSSEGARGGPVQPPELHRVPRRREPHQRRSDAGKARSHSLVSDKKKDFGTNPRIPSAFELFLQECRFTLAGRLPKSYDHQSLNANDCINKC